MVAGRSDHGDIGRYRVADRPLLGNTREQENRTVQDNELRVEKDGEQGQGLSDTLLLRRDDRRMSELFCTIPSCQHPDVCGEIIIEGVSVREKMQQLKSLSVDPLVVAKAIASTYGVQDAEKIHGIIETVSEEMKKKRQGE